MSQPFRLNKEGLINRNKKYLLLLMVKNYLDMKVIQLHLL